jgi:hypothetical protein
MKTETALVQNDPDVLKNKGCKLTYNYLLNHAEIPEFQ